MQNRGMMDLNNFNEKKPTAMTEFKSSFNLSILILKNSAMRKFSDIFLQSSDTPGLRSALTTLSLIPTVRIYFCQGPSKVRRTRGQLMKNIDADYYGYRDEDDGVIVPLEAELEEKRM